MTTFFIASGRCFGYVSINVCMGSAKWEIIFFKQPIFANSPKIQWTISDWSSTIITRKLTTPKRIEDTKLKPGTNGIAKLTMIWRKKFLQKHQIGEYL